MCEAQQKNWRPPMRSYFLALSAMLIFESLSHGDASPQRYPCPNILAEAKSLKTEGARVIDTRTQARYAAGHIAGAVRVDAPAWSKAFNSDPGASGWATRIGDLGIDIHSTVIVYGDGDNPEAARIWWMLRYWGIRDVRLLNGGWENWVMFSGEESSKDSATVMPLRPKLEPQNSRLMTLDQLLQQLKNPEAQIIDARSRAEFCGEKNTAKRNGAIPGAVQLEWKELIDQSTHRFKSRDQLAKLFLDKKIDLNKPAVTHCQSGGRAAVMAFALELMGAKEVSNYYKSWAEWGNAENTPIVKPKE
jgi:thiosulfate/3-mercaptopyruvate sulfurtransferase